MGHGGSSPTLSGMGMSQSGPQHSVKLENGLPTMQSAGSMGGPGGPLPSPHQVGGLTTGQMMSALVSPSHMGLQPGMKQDASALGLPMRPQSTGPLLMANPLAPSGNVLMQQSNQGGTPTMVSLLLLPPLVALVFGFSLRVCDRAFFRQLSTRHASTQGGVSPVQLGGVPQLNGAPRSSRSSPWGSWPLLFPCRGQAVIFHRCARAG